MISTLGNLLGAAFLDPKRLVPPRTQRSEHPYPKLVYHPFAGHAGTTEEPKISKAKTNIPFQRQDHPSKVVAGDWKTHAITGDPAFWEAYHARKRHAWGDNYTWQMQLTHDCTLPRTELRYRNIGTGEQIGSLTRRSPTVYHPIQMGVPDISRHKTRR